MHHTFAYHSSITSTAENEINAVTDGVLPIQNNHIVPQRDAPILYASGAGATLTRMRLASPKFNVVTSPHIQTLSAANGFGNPLLVTDYAEYPLVLRALEELQVFETHTAVGAEDNTFVAGISYGQQPAPPGDIYTIRGTAAATLTAFAWTNVSTITWNNTLPTGQYAIVGGFFESANCLAGRLLLENVVNRPGALGMQSLTGFYNRMFRFGYLGVWGLFHNTVMPQAEFLASAADTSETILLDLIKVQ